MVTAARPEWCSSMLLSVDPGLRGIGAALFVDDLLYTATYLVGSKTGQRQEAWNNVVDELVSWVDASPFKSPGELAIEWQKVYAGRKAKGDPTDLLNLSAITGAVCWAFRQAKTTVYLPSEHRGQVPKDIAIERAKGRLSERETAVVWLPKAKSLQHNVWDAVAIGLTHLKRM